MNTSSFTTKIWRKSLWCSLLTQMTSPFCFTSKQMPPITLASKRSLTSDSDAAGETHEVCCIIHDLLLDTNWAALHSQIQSEVAAEIICWSRGQAPWLGWEKMWSWGWGSVCDEHEKHLFIVTRWWWKGVLCVRTCMGACVHSCMPVCL